MISQPEPQHDRHRDHHHDQQLPGEPETGGPAHRVLLLLFQDALLALIPGFHNHSLPLRELESDQRLLPGQSRCAPAVRAIPQRVTSSPGTPGPCCTQDVLSGDGIRSQSYRSACPIFLPAGCSSGCDTCTCPSSSVSSSRAGYQNRTDVLPLQGGSFATKLIRHACHRIILGFRLAAR